VEARSVLSRQLAAKLEYGNEAVTAPISLSAILGLADVDCGRVVGPC